MSIVPLHESDKPSMLGDIHTCPLRGHSTSFQLVDESGDGQPYAGLAYEITDYEDVVYTGKLDASGAGKVEHHYCGPVVLKLNQPYQGGDELYKDLKNRPSYPLPITELQVRAEKTRFFNKTGVRTKLNPAQDKTNGYCQVEVRELVEHVAHLPPLAARNFPPNAYVHALFRQPPKAPNLPNAGMGSVITPTDRAAAQLGFAPEPPKAKGVALLPSRHHVLEVRPLRALRPVLSIDNEFCALNQYQLAVLATLSYCDFGQDPKAHPVETDSVSFPLPLSSGNWFGEALSKFEEPWQVDDKQTGDKPYYPLYEEVPYSKRLEIAPFDPDLYKEVNSPLLQAKQETPESLHSFDDAGTLDDAGKLVGTDTQVYATHHDELVLIAVRGTAGNPDVYRDLDAEQVPFKEGGGMVHRGFYDSAKVAYDFATKYLDKFHSGQKIIVTGHSLGGAVAMILSQMLRKREGYTYDVLLYTYGAPRSGDAVFVESAKGLKHHRTVNHNDPVPSLPATWMNTSKPTYITGAVLTLVNAPLGLASFFSGIYNFTGASYAHHGTLHHFMPVSFEDGYQSAILWNPSCSTITDQGYASALKATDGLPARGPFLRQVAEFSDHKMVVSYIPHCWATLRRWQESQELGRWLITPREFDFIERALGNINKQLLAKQGESARGRSTVQDREIAALETESRKVDETLARLRNLRHTKASVEKVYGVAASHETFTASLGRWRAHALNMATEQLAMAPPAAIDHDQQIAAITGGYVVGAPFNLDIDALI
ncbi:hypothetical protein J2X66_000273 [Pseudomonas sp. 3296]|jgi:hypothetical protein|uniref:lipase family protein n=1 Tax=Pseudomonas sp. 3296 TaxID=2817753 RepID=UPI002863625F|nr:lipase family protein [Pseudomonas sp. 3296]MDR6913426.1 hypothetical protein [Pseudomonas sp. 3296]